VKLTTITPFFHSPPFKKRTRGIKYDEKRLTDRDKDGEIPHQVLSQAMQTEGD